jgi:hypothetical protein
MARSGPGRSKREMVRLCAVGMCVSYLSLLTVLVSTSCNSIGRFVLALPLTTMLVEGIGGVLDGLCIARGVL